MQISRAWFFVVLLLSAVAALYGPFLWNPIVFDDLQFFMLGSDMLAHWEHFPTLEIRWLPYATIAWTKEIFGVSLIWFRLEAMLLHGLVAVAMFFFLRQLYRQTFADNADGVHEQSWLTGVFIAALFFAVHPVAVYGAGYLIQRTIVMATLFSLLALLCYTKGLEKDNRTWLGASVVFYLLAVLSKEHAIMLPAVMLALTVVVAGVSKALFTRLWPVYAACLLIALFVLSQKLGLMGSAYELYAPEMLEKMDGGSHNYLSSILTQSGLFFKYLGLWLLPDPAWMSVDMREPFAAGPLTPYWFGMLGFMVYGAVAIRLLVKRGSLGLLGLSMVFPWLMFLPEFSTIRIQESFVLYRSYLWMPGIFIALPLLLMRIKKPRIAVISAVLIAVLLTMLAVNRLTTFSHPLLLWDDAEKLVHDQRNLPGVDRIYGNRAKHFDDIKRYSDAVADYQVALSLKPDFAHYYHGLAITYLHMGEYGKAIAGFSKAIELEPDHVRAYFGRGLANSQQGNRIAALADFEKSCELGWKSGCTKVQEMENGN